MFAVLGEDFDFKNPKSFQWGQFKGSTTSPVFENDSMAFFCEGPVFRSLDSNISLDAKNPDAGIVSLFKKHKENFFRYLDGLFILALFDKTSNQVYIVNNPQQAHRLYYTEHPKKFFLSSSLKDLLQHSKIKREPYFPSIKSFLSNGFTQSEKTQIKNVSKMLPADVLVFSANGGSPPRRLTYWSDQFSKERTPFKNLQEQLDLYEATYQQGIRRYLDASSDQRIGCLLSGGHDTSFLVTQLTQTCANKKVHAYTVTFPGWSFDEGQHAQHIAEKFGAEFHPVPFTANDVDAALDLIIANEEPVVGSSLPLHILAQKAQPTVDVIFGGDAGDTLWGEYYPVAEYHRWVHRLPLWLRKGLHKTAKLFRDLTDWERFWELEHVSQLFCEENYHEDFLRKLCTYRHFSDDFQKKLLLGELAKAPYARSYNEIPFTNENFEEALIEGKLYNGFYTYQAFSTAKSIEAFGINFVLPTTQYDLIKFITSLPMKWINGGNTFQRLTNNKKINRKFHKKALQRYLSKNEIYNRSFDIPWYNILRPREELLNHLLAALKRRGWYNPEFLDQIFNEFMIQKVKKSELLELKHHGYRIFTLLSLEIWCQEFLDGRFTDRNTHIKLEDYL